MVSLGDVEGKMPVHSLSLLFFSSPHRLPYMHGQSKGGRACWSTISIVESLYILPRSGLSLGKVVIHNDRVEGGQLLIQWSRILLQALSIQCFLSSKIRFKLFQAAHAHGFFNHQAIKWYLRLCWGEDARCFPFSPILLISILSTLYPWPIKRRSSLWKHNLNRWEPIHPP